jgi:hypothetical protein
MLVSGQLLASGGTFLELPVIAIGSGWDKPVLSAVGGFSKPGLVLLPGSRKCFSKI